ncbi:type 4b pilus protein PilO2 [Caballeronia sp. LP003]|uniref:type 4b pilus protein PilO2 n=1 Tax=Caballeronia sp. LP003 TaxID=3038551 RepID=UPI0028585B9C|nr:type 4b pilus protein PilO2 [Caballeronia sp. LP003]MDR5791732.1 type 4b pilus protein PilO2 [Caballeronia sp. LP003]
MTEIVTLPGVKHTFAVGLSWRHEDAVPKPKQLRALSLDEGRWGLIRKSNSDAIQVGFCDPIIGKNPGKLRSLAAVVADHHPQPWMGLYKLADDRYWYIAVRDGHAIIPGGDQVGTFEEMAKVRESHLQYGQWHEVEGTVEDLVEMALLTPRMVALRDMQVSPYRSSAILGLSVFGVGLVGLLALSGYQHYAERRALEEQEKNGSKYQRVQAPPPKPWTQEPMPSAVFIACHQAWSIQPLAASGWTLGTWDCQATKNAVTVTATWDRDGGIAADAPGSLAADGNSATSTKQYIVAFDPPAVAALDEPTGRRAIWSLAQASALDLQIGSAAPTASNLPGAAATQTPVVPWTSVPAKFKFAAPPWATLGSAFDSVDGLRVSAVSWSASTPLWVTTATLYSMRAMPTAALSDQKTKEQGAKT